MNKTDEPFRFMELIVVKNEVEYLIRCHTKELQEFVIYDSLKPPSLRPHYYNSDNLLVYCPKPERPGWVVLRTYEENGGPWSEFSLADPLQFQSEIGQILQNFSK